MKWVEPSDYDQHMGQIWEEQVEKHYVPGAGRGCLEDLSQTALLAGVSLLSSLHLFSYLRLTSVTLWLPSSLRLYYIYENVWLSWQSASSSTSSFSTQCLKLRFNQMQMCRGNIDIEKQAFNSHALVRLTTSLTKFF